MIVYISIGNSDDKLTQREWSDYWGHVGGSVRRWADTVHGEWLSLPSDPYQNACWCVDIDGDKARLMLRPDLEHLARDFRQDSIAWAECREPEMIRPA